MQDSNNIEVLKIVLEKNPREIKQFINAYIISNEIYSEHTDNTKLLFIQCLKWRWPKMYNLFSSNVEFRKIIEDILTLNQSQRESKINAIIEDDDGKQKVKNKEIALQKQFIEPIRDIREDKEFWDFLAMTRIFFEIDIKSWEHYRRASDIADEQKRKHKGMFSNKMEMYDLLRNGDIRRFNEIMDTYSSLSIDLRNRYLVKANLEGVNLNHADLKNAILVGVNLRGAKLCDANLKSVDLTNAQLESGDLKRVDLRGANLTDADLRLADLRGANLEGVNLRGVYLRGVDFTDANLRMVNFRGTDLRGINLNNADLAGADLRETKNIPISKEEIKKRGAII